MHTVFRGVLNRVEEKIAKTLQDYLVFFYIFEKLTYLKNQLSFEKFPTLLGLNRKRFMIE